MTATSRPATTTVPPLSDDIEDLFEDLRGAHPGIDLILDGLRLIALDQHTLAQTATLLTVLAGDSAYRTDIQALTAAVIARLTDAATNPCLRQLTPTQANEARQLGRTFVAHDDTFAPRSIPAEAAHLIGTAT